MLGESAVDIRADDDGMLKTIARTPITGKGAETARERLVDLIARAVKAVADDDGSAATDHIKVEKKVSGSVEDSDLIEGMVVDRGRVHPDMPRAVRDGTGSAPQCTVRGREDRNRRNDQAQRSRSVARSSSGRSSMKGGAWFWVSSRVSWRAAPTHAIVVTGCRNPKAVTLLIRGGTGQVDDAFHAVPVALGERRCVPGGGAPEIELALWLRDYASGVEGRMRLAIEAFAHAMEIVPPNTGRKTQAGIPPGWSPSSNRPMHAGKRRRGSRPSKAGSQRCSARTLSSR